jgi:hypothetical protein
MTKEQEGRDGDGDGDYSESESNPCAGATLGRGRAEWVCEE